MKEKKARVKLSAEERAFKKAEKSALLKAKQKLRLAKLKAKHQKVEAKPLTEEQISEFVAFYKKHKKFPSTKIPCNITGRLTTCVGDWLVKKIKEYGSAEDLLRKYVSRGALKAQRESSKPVVKKKKSRMVLDEMKNEDKTWDLPKIDLHSVPKPLSPAEVTEYTKDCCFRPDVYLNNDGHCEGCRYFDLCSCRLKCLPKKKRK
jgi:hypothetical protein